MHDLKDLAEVRAMPGYPLEEQEQCWLIQWTKRHGPPEARALVKAAGKHILEDL